MEQLAKLADTIVGQMKEGAARWFMPWHNGIQEPVNTVTGKVFRGRNAAILLNGGCHRMTIIYLVAEEQVCDV